MVKKYPVKQLALPDVDPAPLPRGGVLGSSREFANEAWKFYVLRYKLTVKMEPELRTESLKISAAFSVMDATICLISMIFSLVKILR